MHWFWDLNLIRFFDFYLAVAFLASSTVRFRQYRMILSMLRAFPGRWPRLLQLVKEHSSVFLTWSTVGPAILALLLMIMQLLASRLVWPQAGQPPHGLTVGLLAAHLLAVPFVTLFGAAMCCVDTYFLIAVSEIDRQQLEKYFDQAEYWLKPWAAPVIRVFTLGVINPRKMVATEVRSALIAASQLLNTTLWWLSLQVGLRIAFGLSLWLTYAWSNR